MTNEKSYAETEGAFNAYCAYVALKTHFTDSGYDYFRHNGKLKFSPSAFKKRNDREHFYRLSKLPDYEKRILSHLLKNTEAYILDICDDEKPFREWSKRSNALAHFLKEEISTYKDLDDALTPKKGQYPDILVDHLNDKVSLETITVLDICLGVMDKWKSEISDPFVFPTLHTKVRKYKPFLNIDKTKMTNIIYPREGKTNGKLC